MNRSFQCHFTQALSRQSFKQLIPVHFPVSLHKLLLVLILFSMNTRSVDAQKQTPVLHYIVSIFQPASHTYLVELHCSRWEQDSIRLKMPRWMPGYYQIMDYEKSVENFWVTDENGAPLAVDKTSGAGWLITGIKNKPFIVKYKVRTEKQFVANSYVDSGHAYLIPENSFLYIDGYLKTPVSVSFLFTPEWKNIVTGLEGSKGKTNEFSAPDFDILYDCPILIGNLLELPSFKVKGIEHRFIGYKTVNFDQILLMNNLKKVVEAGVAVIGNIPYQQYSFIGIGPGRGGIEHLNNTTIGFDGSGLDKPETMSKTLNFIAHEYFHHFNVKRIRPLELGPFDYENGNRTNQLWISEGLTVYYEYLIVKRAGLVDEKKLLQNFNGNLNALENSPGRQYQSLQQASYSTWSDGPYGTMGNEPDKTISYYDKGPIVGLLLDFTIRNATQNKRSLDDVMRLLYWKYYKEAGRGFTEAEFQAACEKIAGVSLNNIFEYVYTTKEIDYAHYLAYAGLKLEQQNIESTDKGTSKAFFLVRLANPTPLQTAILKSWMGE